MLFWLICALITAAVTWFTLRPVIVRAAITHESHNPDLLVYKDQLSELDRDAAGGLLTPDEAEAARIEVSRRILAADEGHRSHAPATTTTPGIFSQLVFYLSAAVIVTGAAGLYLVNGSPGYGSRPFAIRAEKSPSGAPVGELIARVEARLREVPGDGRGWDVLAPVYLKQQRHQDAIRAYSRAIELLGENRARLRGLAEAHLAQSNGIVGPEVRKAYEKILAKEPELIAPRFWLAVGLEQDGDAEGAAAAYQALLKGVSGNDAASSRRLPPALAQLIRARLASIKGNSPTQPLAPKKQDDAGSGSEVGKGPPPPAGVASGMSSDQRQAMIEQMVSGLATRLQNSGGSAEEWQRLIRAYWVMGRRPQATAALEKARATFADDAEVGGQLTALAEELGMKPPVKP